MQNYTMCCDVTGLLEMPLTFRHYDYLEYYPQLQQSDKSSDWKLIRFLMYCCNF